MSATNRRDANLHVRKIYAVIPEDVFQQVKSLGLLYKFDDFVTDAILHELEKIDKNKEKGDRR